MAESKWYQDDAGNISAMRLMTMVAVVVLGLVAIMTWVVWCYYIVRKGGEWVSPPVLESFAPVAAMLPKAIQKFGEPSG